MYKLLGKGVVAEESFTPDWKESLDVYMKQWHEIDCESVVLKSCQTELLKCIKPIFTGGGTFLSPPFEKS